MIAVGNQNPITQKATPRTPSAPAVQNSAGIAVMIEAEASTMAICTAADESSKWWYAAKALSRLRSAFFALSASCLRPSAVSR